MQRIYAAAIFALFASGFAQAQSPPIGMSVSGSAINRSTLNSSATITAGNTFQTILASNFGTAVQRQALTIENNNATDSCWIFIGPLASATKATSILLLAGGSYTRYWPFVPSDAINATCATSSDTLYVDNN